MNCWKCSKEIEEISKKISFRAQCPHCGIDLHACTNCHYYAPGKPNDCIVPGTDFVRDRDAANFCEDFKIKSNASSQNRPQNQKKFNSLFKDEDL